MRWSGLSPFYYGNYECPFFRVKHPANFHKKPRRQRPQPSVVLSSPSPEALSNDAAEGPLLWEWCRLAARPPSGVVGASPARWRQIGNLGRWQGSRGLCLLAPVAVSAASLFRKPSVQEVCARTQAHVCCLESVVWFLFMSVTFSPLAGE